MVSINSNSILNNSKIISSSNNSNNNHMIMSLHLEIQDQDFLIKIKKNLPQNKKKN